MTQVHGSLNGLVTMIWLLLLFGILAIYTIVFWILRCTNRNSPKILNEKENEVVAYVEYVPSSNDVEGQANIPVHTTPRTIFGTASVEEFIFDFVRNRTFYSVTVEKDLIKTSQIWSRSSKQALIAFNKNSDDFQGTNDARIRFKSAPLAMYTHMESIAVRAWPTWYQFWASVWWNFYRFLEHNAVFFVTILMLVAVITCFYTPGTFDSDYSHDNSYPQMSFNLTIVMFAFTVAAVLMHCVYTYSLGKKSWRTRIVGLVAFVLLLVALAMAITLMDVAYSNGGQKKTHSINWQSAMDQFSCYCDKNTTHTVPTSMPSVHPSESPTFIPTDRPTQLPTEVPSIRPTFSPTFPNDPTTSPTESPTYPTTQYPSEEPTAVPFYLPTNKPHSNFTWDNAYSFQCTWDQFAASNYNSCDMNCGVCGETYYAPFVTFSVFSAAYLLLMLYLAFETFFAGHIFWTGFEMIPSYKPVTHMKVKIHGSRGFGFPLTTRMTLAEMLRLERYLKDYVESQKEIKPVDYMRHMAYVSSGVGHKWFQWGWYTGY